MPAQQVMGCQARRAERSEGGTHEVRSVLDAHDNI